MSQAIATFGSMPNSSAISKDDFIPASCGMSSNCVACSIFTEPSLPLIKRTMFLSRRRCLYSLLTSLIQVSPRTRRSKVSSENTFSPPGRPSEIPVITTGSSFRVLTVEIAKLLGLIAWLELDIEVI